MLLPILHHPCPCPSRLQEKILGELVEYILHIHTNEQMNERTPTITEIDMETKGEIRNFVNHI